MRTDGWADGWTDGHDEAKSLFRNFANALANGGLKGSGNFTKSYRTTCWRIMCNGEWRVICWSLCVCVY